MTANPVTTPVQGGPHQYVTLVDPTGNASQPGAGGSVSLGNINISGPAATDPFQATVFVPGKELRVNVEAGQLLYTGFDTGLNTADVFKTPTAAGGGVAASSVVSFTQLGTGTTANGYSYLESQPSFPPVNPGWLNVTYGNNIPFPYIANTYFFWGTGFSPATPTAAIPIQEGAGWEIAIGGKLFAVMYAGGARTFAVDCSSTGTGIAANKQPLDANVHYYTMFYRGDQTYWCIDSPDNLVAFTTTGAPGPNLNTLPVKLSAIAGAVAPLSSGVLTCNVVYVADTTVRATQGSDGLFPWRKWTIDSFGNLQIKLANTAGGTTDFHLVSLATTNASIIKNTTGQLYSYEIYNTAAAARFIKLYNKATAPVPGTDTPVRTIGVAAGSHATGTFPQGISAFPLGIGLATTTGLADADATAVAANDLVIDIDYK